VRTKFSKAITTYFLPVGAKTVDAWVRYLREEKLWGKDDPLFPATRVALGAKRQFEPCGLGRSHWKTTTPIRTIFREAFKLAGLTYFNPHSLRHTLARISHRQSCFAGCWRNKDRGKALLPVA
jgi:integrase